MGSKSSKQRQPINVYTTCNAHSAHAVEAELYHQSQKQGHLYPHIDPTTGWQNPEFKHNATMQETVGYQRQVQSIPHVQGEYGARVPSAPPLSLVTEGIKSSKKANTTVGDFTQVFRKHDRFLKNIVIEIPEHYTRKGFYCGACSIGFGRINKDDIRITRHKEGELHLQKTNADMINRYCLICRVEFFCSEFFWQRHQASEVHKFWEEKNERTGGAIEKLQRCGEEFKGKKSYLVVTGFPLGTKWRLLKYYFSDFDFSARVEMGKKESGLEYARVLFSRRLTAFNIQRSGFPLRFENRLLKTEVEWMV